MYGKAEAQRPFLYYNIYTFTKKKLKRGVHFWQLRFLFKVGAQIWYPIVQKNEKNQKSKKTTELE